MMEKQDDEQVTTSVRIPVAALERMKKTVDITILTEKGPRRSIINIQKRVSVKIRIMIEVEIHNFDIVFLLSVVNLLHEVFIG